MKLFPWLLALHVLALAIACALAMHTDRDGTRLMAWGLALLIAGWGSIVVAIGYVLLRALRKQLTARDAVVAMILVFIGVFEKNTGAFWYEHIQGLPGWTWAL